MDIVKRLEQAAAAGEILKVIYHGGSQKGAVRELAPIRVTGRKFHARCIATGKFKFYLVEKVEVVGENLPLPDDWSPDIHSEYDPEYSRDSIIYSDLSSYIENHTPRFSNLGLIVINELHEIEFDGDKYTYGSYSLHTSFKNGKPRKTPEISLYVQPFEDELGQFPSENSNEIYIKPRPYSVYSNGPTKSFSLVNSALKYFHKQSSEILK